MYVEYTETPLAIETKTPRFSWEVPLQGRTRSQSAYRILVAATEEQLEAGVGDSWDSAKIESSQSMNISYEGTELLSNKDYWWSVKIWDEKGESEGFSKAQYFGTALYEQSDWQAKWIGLCDPNEPIPDPNTKSQGRTAPEVEAFEHDPRSPLMRKEFSLCKKIRRARAFVCGLGFFELRLNGNKVGEDVLSTSRTDFRKRVLYSTYDITQQLRSGENVLGLILGNGWYNGQREYWGWAMPWHGSPRAIIQLAIEFEDGSLTQVISDDSWRGDWSPITSNCIYDGEKYDSRLEQNDWDSPSFDDSKWSNVNQVPGPGGNLSPISHEQNKVVERSPSVSQQEISPGVYVIDLGRNMTGWLRLKIKEGIRGQEIKMRFAEDIFDDGSINCSTAGEAKQEDRYIMKGASEECFEPRFTYHGFQYVEITGYPGVPTPDNVEACFVHTAVEETGEFESGNELINRIHTCTVQTQLCNLQMGVVTDDTQRAERLGWCDCWESAVQTYYNFSMPRVWNKWIGDYRDQQDEQGMVGYIVPLPNPGEDLVWSASFLLIPWWQYLHCGDRRILEENYESQQRYLAYLEATGTKEVNPNTSEELEEMLRWQCSVEDRFPSVEDRGHLQISYFGDHLSVCEGSSGFTKNQPLSIATAFYYQNVRTMAQIAEVLGKEKDAKGYRSQASEIKDAFNERFLNASWGYYDTGSQNAQAWALSFGLVPEEHISRVSSYLNSSVNFRQGSLTTGLVGTKYAVEAIALSGRNDIVWNRAIATDYPSWGYMIRDPKRTTFSENWLGKASLCHSNLAGAIDEWFYWGLAGIRPDENGPGYEKIIFKPYLPMDLPWARASIKTPRGRIISSWKHDGTTATLEITVPANCTASVYIPTNDSGGITESGDLIDKAHGVTFMGTEDDASLFSIGSGKYHFEFGI